MLHIASQRYEIAFLINKYWMQFPFFSSDSHFPTGSIQRVATYTKIVYNENKQPLHFPRPEGMVPCVGPVRLHGEPEFFFPFSLGNHWAWTTILWRCGELAWVNTWHQNFWYQSCKGTVWDTDSARSATGWPGLRLPPISLHPLWWSGPSWEPKIQLSRRQSTGITCNTFNKTICKMSLLYWWATTLGAFISWYLPRAVSHKVHARCHDNLVVSQTVASWFR